LAAVYDPKTDHFIVPIRRGYTMSVRVHAAAAVLALCVASGGFAVTTAQAQSAGVNIGRLECVVEGGIGLIITSKKQMQCLYRSTTGREETYFGSIRKFGLDIGITGQAYMVWGVFAPGVVDNGALAGNYVGGSAEASAGVGAGANALVGGTASRCNRSACRCRPASMQRLA
jgi:hypothetical protein